MCGFYPSCPCLFTLLSLPKWPHLPTQTPLETLCEAPFRGNLCLSASLKPCLRQHMTYGNRLYTLRRQAPFRGNCTDPRVIARHEAPFRGNSLHYPSPSLCFCCPRKTLSIPHDAFVTAAHTLQTLTTVPSTLALFLLTRSTEPKLQYLSAQEGVLERIFTAPSVRPYAF